MSIETVVALALAVSYILGPIVTLRNAQIQAQAQEKSEIEKRIEEASAIQKFSESWDKLLDAQQEEFDRSKQRWEDELTSLKKKASEREDELMEDIAALSIRVNNLEQERIQQDKQIADLHKQLRSVKKTTDELNDRTGQFKTQKRKDSQ